MAAIMATAKRKHAQSTTETIIPEKIYFRIGEVSALAKLPTYVLRFWETEFPQLRPTKSSTGQRMYRRRDVEYVMQIRRLLYEDGFTIAGARERLREETRTNRAQNRDVSPVPSAEAVSVVPQTAQESAQPPLLFSSSTTGNHGQQELRRVRQQLSEVLDLLS